MPIYQYKSKQAGCDHCRDGFECMQLMSESPLTKCPHCGSAVKKVPSLFSGHSSILSDGNLRDHGFSKLVNKGDGNFEKTV